MASVTISGNFKQILNRFDILDPRTYANLKLEQNIKSKIMS